jgi:nitrate/nitrite transporter NarK
MTNVIVTYTGVATAIGMLLLFMKAAQNKVDIIADEPLAFADVLLILQQPLVCILCVILTAVYHLFWATIEFPSLAETGGFGMPLAAATALGASKLWMRPIGGVLGGMIGDKVSNVRLMLWLFTAGIVGSLYLALVEASPEFAWTLWIFIFPFGLLVYAARGVFWALLYECRLPKKVLGSAIGFISIMGYSSDAYIPQVSSRLHSAYAATTAYQLFYGYIAFAAAVGFAARWMMIRRVAASAQKAAVK